MSRLRHRLDRRQVLRSAGGAAGALALGPRIARGVGAQEEVQLALRHDVAIGPLLEPYVQDFNDRYPYELGTSYPPQDYFGTTQTQLAGGSVDFDVLFTDEGYNQTWWDNGWIRQLDDLPGVADVLADLPDDLEPALHAADGTLIALPYYRGFEVFCYNGAHLDQVSATPPATWDEFVETCRKLKTDGVTDTPFSPFWGAEFSLIWYEFMNDFLSESTNPVFGENYEPLFASDSAAAATLERWQTLYREELVPADVFTTAYGDTVNIFGGGQSSFTARYTAQLVGWKDPEQSTVADQIGNALMPGTTRGTISFGGTWVMAGATENPEAAWDLIKYFAWKDLDGEYYFCKNFLAIGLGLATAWEAVNNDPEVRESWSAWADVDALTEQIARSRAIGPATNQTWYREFVDTTVPILQDVAREAKDVDEGLQEIADFVNAQLGS
jgi:multiple sugar transport system substrate-binding protein